MPASDEHVVYEPVDSSNIEAVGYGVARGNLWVKFKGGAKYVYYHVESRVYLDFRAAPSKGRFLFRVIRANGTDSVYAYEKVA